MALSWKFETSDPNKVKPGVPLDPDCWESIAAAIIKKSSYDTAIIPQLCKDAKRGYRAAITILAENTILPTIRDKKMRQMLFDQLIKTVSSWQIIPHTGTLAITTLTCTAESTLMRLPWA
jgi:hypothetical protein